MPDQSEKASSSLLKPLFFLISFGLLAGAWYGYDKYTSIFGANVPDKLEDDTLTIPTGTNFKGLTKILHENKLLLDTSSFVWVAQKMTFSKVRPGKFTIQENWNNRQLINHLRAGKQATVNVVINNERLIGDVAGKVSQFIEPDSIAILNTLLDKNNLTKNGYNIDNVISMFIPNTYEFYWSTSPDKFIEKMMQENEKFWSNADRKSKAAKLEMTPEEIYSLASIVEKETNQNKEKARIAGVYLNRIKRGIPLQADPTVVFANKDFSIRRVLNKHLEYDSPFNTYLHKGIPPGPISIASIASIDAVLNYENHKYLYFCAKPDNSGLHAFAKSLAAHNVNAQKFQSWLNKRGIR